MHLEWSWWSRELWWKLPIWLPRNMAWYIIEIWVQRKFQYVDIIIPRKLEYKFRNIIVHKRHTKLNENMIWAGWWRCMQLTLPGDGGACSSLYQSEQGINQGLFRTSSFKAYTAKPGNKTATLPNVLMWIPYYTFNNKATLLQVMD